MKFAVSRLFPITAPLFKNYTDMMFDANKFTVAAVCDDDFDRLSDDKLKYNYAWVKP